jgi:hypothetical protein
VHNVAAIHSQAVSIENKASPEFSSGADTLSNHVGNKDKERYRKKKKRRTQVEE